MVGIPRGLVLPLLFGIYTLLIFDAFPSNLKFLISLNLSSGFIDFIPSIPAVDLPVLSCVIRLIANSLAFLLFTSIRWMLWANLISPFLMALYIFTCQLNTVSSISAQLSSDHLVSFLFLFIGFDFRGLESQLRENIAIALSTSAYVLHYIEPFASYWILSIHRI